MTASAGQGVRSGRAQIVLALLAGAAIPLSFAPLFFWPAAIAGVALCYWLIFEVTHWRAGFFLGWLIGVGKYAVGASWIYVSIHEQGGASESLAGVLVGLFVAGMALFSGLFGALFGWANRSGYGGGYRVALFAACWVLAEWSLTWLLTGFPWLFVGYGVQSTWLAGFAPVVGVLGLSVLTCLLGAGLVSALHLSAPSRGRVAVLLATVVAFASGWGLEQVRWVSLGEPHSVALVQGNIEQRTKWNPENRGAILTTYERLSEPHWSLDLIVWPEAAITLFAQQAGPWLERWQQRGATTGTTLVLGLPDVVMTEDGAQMFQNTAVALGSGSGRYVKRRLVPFGEYVPLESLLRGLIAFFDLPMSRSGSGPEHQPPLLGGPLSGSDALGQQMTMGVAICYEIAYPELVRTSAADAGLLLTISNDAWFGASIGPHQHLQIAQMRALENGRYVLRSTNNGVTAIIDERGVIQAALPQFQADVLTGEFAVAQGRTPFNRFGHWPVVLIALLVWLSSVLAGKAGGILRHA